MANSTKTTYHWTARILACLACIVVLLGAYTRLVDAGLGCPDWPGCYGQLSVPNTPAEIAKAHAAFPHADPVEASKAWPEMIHRYVAGSLGLGIFVLLLWGAKRNADHRRSAIVPLCLLGTLLFQAVLGMWTVTFKLHPLVVMGHLLGGMTITSLLWWLSLPSKEPTAPHPWLTFAYAGLLITGLQIFLGGWTSANYAALICPDFPYCQGQFLPHMDFHTGFNLFSPIGNNYQGGILSTAARIAIQMAHRLGGIVTGVVLATLSLGLLFKARHQRPLAALLGLLLLLQISLGIANVVELLPLPVAVLHNGVALLLLLTLVTLIHRLKYPNQ